MFPEADTDFTQIITIRTNMERLYLGQKAPEYARVTKRLRDK
jgi:hypothetical protein